MGHPPSGPVVFGRPLNMVQLAKYVLTAAANLGTKTGANSGNPFIVPTTIYSLPYWMPHWKKMDIIGLVAPKERRFAILPRQRDYEGPGTYD